MADLTKEARIKNLRPVKNGMRTAEFQAPPLTWSEQVPVHVLNGAEIGDTVNLEYFVTTAPDTIMLDSGPLSIQGISLELETIEVVR